jgi:hypothetical protein
VLALSRKTQDDAGVAEMSATLPVEFADRPTRDSAPLCLKHCALVTLLAPIAVTPPAEIVTSPVSVWQIGSAAAWPTASCAEVQSSEV